MKPKGLTRRDFLKGSASATLAGAFYLSLPGKLSARPGEKSRVVLIREQNVLNDKNVPDYDVMVRMLNEAVITLLGEKDPAVAWKRLIKPDDIVGIKSNVWQYIPVPEALEWAIYNMVRDAGVSKKNISINDRFLHTDMVFQNATALINVRPMRTHYWSGVGSLIKNYIMFIDDPPSYHPDTCADLATIWELPLVKGKTRLNILVMLTPLFQGSGPHHYNPKYTWAYNGLLVGTDPVAVDATGLRILQAKRREFFGEDRPLDPPPKHILLADTRHGLGTADPEKIELIKLGWQEGTLI